MEGGAQVLGGVVVVCVLALLFGFVAAGALGLLGAVVGGVIGGMTDPALTEATNVYGLQSMPTLYGAVAGAAVGFVVGLLTMRGTS